MKDNILIRVRDVKKNEPNPFKSATSEKFEHEVLTSNFTILL